MTAFPGSPQVQHGSLIAIDQSTKKTTTIQFQYNPDTLTRKLAAQAAGDNADKGEIFRLKGPPEETITLDIEIDATDKLEAGDSLTKAEGISPMLAALELLLYPQSRTIIQNDDLARKGMIEVLPTEAPLTIFNWGQKRSLPVRITTFSIVEEAFDPALNPVRAKISLELRVLNYMDLGLNTKGGQAYLTYHKGKEQLSKKNTFGR
jgi:hypothetical protein